MFIVSVYRLLVGNIKNIAHKYRNLKDSNLLNKQP